MYTASSTVSPPLSDDKWFLFECVGNILLINCVGYAGDVPRAWELALYANPAGVRQIRPL
jgi:hypothetical protein